MNSVEDFESWKAAIKIKVDFISDNARQISIDDAPIKRPLYT